jgi:ribulose 1,5-bisphosphate carboxylase large subunit-like protein
MQVQATFPELTIEQTVEQILTCRKITRNQQRWLISLCFKGSLSYQQDNLINQVYEALRQGLLLVVD